MNNQSKGLIEFYKYLQVAKEAAQAARNIGGQIRVPDAKLLDELERIEEQINDHEARFELQAYAPKPVQSEKFNSSYGGTK